MPGTRVRARGPRNGGGSSRTNSSRASIWLRFRPKPTAARGPEALMSGCLRWPNPVAPTCVIGPRSKPGGSLARAKRKLRRSRARGRSVRLARSPGSRKTPRPRFSCPSPNRRQGTSWTPAARYAAKERPAGTPASPETRPAQSGLAAPAMGESQRATSVRIKPTHANGGIMNDSNKPRALSRRQLLVLAGTGGLGFRALALRPFRPEDQPHAPSHAHLKDFVPKIRTPDVDQRKIVEKRKNVRHRVHAKLRKRKLQVARSSNAGSYAKDTGLRRYMYGNTKIGGSDIDLPFILTARSGDHLDLKALL